MKHFAFWCLTLAVGLACHRQAVVSSGDDVSQIRALREASNRAIAAHDTGGVAAAWSDSIFVIASTGARSGGRAANARNFANQFQTRPGVRYLRTAERVRLYAPWGMAVEEGHWEGEWREGGEGGSRIQIGGRYLARWRREAGGWRIVAEMYAPTHCSGGAYCDRRP
jgi:ketosteroid isomerase-like protein